MTPEKKAIITEGYQEHALYDHNDYYVKAQKDYPNNMFGDTAAKYMMEVLHLDLGGNKSNQ